MAKRTVNISGTVGAQEIPADRTAWVNVRSEYTFDDGSTRNFAVPQTVTIVNGQAQLELEPVVDGVRPPWRFEFVFADRQEKVQSIITEVRRFPADGLTTPIDYNALEFTEPVSPEYGPTYAQQAEEAAERAEDAADRAEAVGESSDAQTANNVTSGTLTRAALSNTFFPLDFLKAIFAGWLGITYGHSFLAEQGLSDVTKHWARRFTSALGMIYPTSPGGATNDLKRAVGGSEVLASVGRALNSAPYVPGPNQFVIIENLINTARLHGAVTADLVGAENAMRSLMAGLNAASKVEETAAAVTYSGTWTTQALSFASGGSTKATAVDGAYVQFTADANDSYVSTVGRGGGVAGCVIAVTDQTAGGASLGTIDTSNQTFLTSGAAMVWQVPESARGHVIRWTKVSGTSMYFDAILIQSKTPPVVLWMKEPYLGDYSYSTSFPNGSDAALDAFNGLVDVVARTFPNIIVADPQKAGYWTKAQALPGGLLQSDGVHPSEAGGLALFLTARDALFAYVFRRAAQVNLSASGTAPVGDTVKPSVPTGLTATPGPGSVALSWTASTDNVAVTGYRVYQDDVLIASPTGTSYTVAADTSHVFKVSALDAAGNESAKSTGVTGTPTPYDFTADPTLIVWYKSDSLSALADGAQVASWAPAGGSETAPLARSTAAQRPVMSVGAVLNGHRAVIFDGADDNLAAVLSAAKSNPLTILVVGQIGNANGTIFAGPFTIQEDASGANLTVYGTGTAGVKILAPLAPGSGYHSIAVVGNAASSSLSVDGAKVSGTLSSGSLNILRLGNTNASAGYLTGGVVAVAVFAAALSDAQIATALAAMAA